MVTSLVGSVWVTTAAAATSGPTVNVSTKTTTVGELVQVTGAGWSPVGGTVQIALCGQDALNVSTDCDQADEYTAAIRSGGVFYGAIVTRFPPSPCPCVVLVHNEGSFSGVSVPISVVGARTSPVPTRPQSSDPVTVSAKVLSGMSVGSWFGGPAKVTLLLHVRNRSTADFASPALSVTVGRGAHPSGFVMAGPLAPLAAGATQVLRIPVTLPAFTFGQYSVRAQVITGEGQIATVARTSSYPWGLFLIAALVLQALLLLLRNRVRARLARRVPEMPVAEPELQGEVEPVEVIDLRVPSVESAEVTEAAGQPTEPVGAVDLGQTSSQPVDVAAVSDDQLAEAIDVIDLRPSSAHAAHLWTTTHRIALVLAQQRLACTVEVLACPLIKLQRTTVRAWADFALSSWDALHEGNIWADLASDPGVNPLVPDATFVYHGKGLRLELDLVATGSELAVDDHHSVLPVRVRGSVSSGDDVSEVDIESVLEKTWVTDASEDSSAATREPSGGSVTYAQAARGDSFYLRLGADGEPAGWLARNGHPSAIVHAERRVAERAGPYPRRVVVEVTDDLGRRALADGTAHKGMTSKGDEHLTLECQMYWNLDGAAASGEDRSEIDLDTWRAATRAAFYTMANQNGTSATIDHAPPLPPVEPADHLTDSARG